MGPRARPNGQTEAQPVFVNCLCVVRGGGGQRGNLILFYLSIKTLISTLEITNSVVVFKGYF